MSKKKKVPEEFKKKEKKVMNGFGNKKTRRGDKDRT